MESFLGILFVAVVVLVIIYKKKPEWIEKIQSKFKSSNFYSVDMLESKHVKII